MRYVIATLCVIVLMLSVSPALPYGKGTVDVEIISDKGDVFQSFLSKTLEQAALT